MLGDEERSDENDSSLRFRLLPDCCTTGIETCIDYGVVQLVLTKIRNATHIFVLLPMMTKRICSSLDFRFIGALIAARFMTSLHIDDAPSSGNQLSSFVSSEQNTLTIGSDDHPSNRCDIRTSASILNTLAFVHSCYYLMD